MLVVCQSGGLSRWDVCFEAIPLSSIPMHRGSRDSQKCKGRKGAMMERKLTDAE